MANEKRDASGSSGGTDVEPLGGGMREEERKQGSAEPERPGYAGEEHDRETAAKKDPPSPYHDVKVAEGGLAPQAAPGEGTTPPAERGEIEATAGHQIARERGDQENEAGNAPRTDPASRGVDR